MNNTTTTIIPTTDPDKNPNVGIIIFFVVFVTIAFGGLFYFTFDYLCCKEKNNTKQKLLNTIDDL